MTQQTEKLRRRDLVKMPHMVVRAVLELSRARMILRSIGAKDIDRLNQAARNASRANNRSLTDEATIARIGFAVTYAASHVPWRSDCLPQAIAAQNWLKSKNLVSEIRIGVERPGDGQFGAHAWLVQGDQIVTGGEIEHFSVLLGDEPSQALPDTPPSEK